MKFEVGLHEQLCAEFSLRAQLQTEVLKNASL